MHCVYGGIEKDVGKRTVSKNHVPYNKIGQQFGFGQLPSKRLHGSPSPRRDTLSFIMMPPAPRRASGPRNLTRLVGSARSTNPVGCTCTWSMCSSFAPITRPSLTPSPCANAVQRQESEHAECAKRGTLVLGNRVRRRCCSSRPKHYTRPFVVGKCDRCGANSLSRESIVWSLP
jgi:hypothetical protein